MERCLCKASIHGSFTEASDVRMKVYFSAFKSNEERHEVPTCLLDDVTNVEVVDLGSRLHQATRFGARGVARLQESQEGLEVEDWQQGSQLVEVFRVPLLS